MSKKGNVFEGQVSMFDLSPKPQENHKNVEKITENRVSVMEIKVLDTEIVVSCTKTNDLKSKLVPGNLITLHEITQDQLGKIEEYKAHPQVTQIIHYGGGGIGIELLESETFKTIYVNKSGKEEFSYNKQLAVLPMDRIVYTAEASAEPAKETIEDIRKAAKVGDFIETTYAKEIVQATIVREYNSGQTFNISFQYNGELGQTAIPRLAVRKILKCA